MSDQFLKSVKAIRVESFDMLKSLRAVRGENYSRLVHAIILVDQAVGITQTFVDGASESTKELAQSMQEMQEKMIALVMEYYIRSTSMSEAQIKEAFADAERVLKTTTGLVHKAAEMARSGQSMGAE